VLVISPNSSVISYIAAVYSTHLVN